MSTQLAAPQLVVAQLERLGMTFIAAGYYLG
jgi:hypothetical protein